jgi:hypothetical protein
VRGVLVSGFSTKIMDEPLKFLFRKTRNNIWLFNVISHVSDEFGLERVFFPNSGICWCEEYT